LSSGTDFLCMVIMNIVWWMNLQMYDAFWYLLLMFGG
jgi:hypothetical protein